MTFNLPRLIEKLRGFHLSSKTATAGPLRAARETDNYICQSGSWAKLFSIDGQATNYSTTDFTGVCDAFYGGGVPYVCRYVRKLLTVSKNKALIISLYATGPIGGNDDVVTSIYINGATCTSSRMLASAVPTGLASTSCVRWIEPGTYLIDLAVTGSTGVATKAGRGIQGGLISF